MYKQQAANTSEGEQRMNAGIPWATLDTIRRANWTTANVPLNWRGVMGRRGLLIAVIHGTWCHACPGQLAWLRRRYAWLAGQGIGVVAVSVDDPAHLAAFQSTLWVPLPFPLISDQDAALSRALGLYNEVTGITRSAVLMIDRAGSIRFAQLDKHSMPEQARLLEHIEQMPAT